MNIKRILNGLSVEYWVAIICKIVVILTELLITVCINRGLGVFLKGEYSYIIKMVEILYIVFSVGIGQTYSTYKRKFNESFMNDFVTLGLVQGLIVLLIGIVFVRNIPIEYGIEIVVLTAVAVVKAIISMIAVTENSISRNLVQVTINIMYVALLALACFLNKCTLHNVITLYALSDIIRVIVLMHIYKMKPNIGKFTISEVTKIYKTGFITMIVMLLVSLNYSVDTIMLKKMSEPYYVGIYSVGASFSNIFLMIPDAFKDVLFGDSAKKNFSEKTAYSAIKVSLLISIIALAGFAFLGKYIIRLLYGSEYVSSYTVTLILFIGCFSLIFFKILQPVYISHGKQIRALVFLLVSALMNIISNILLIPVFNEIGAAMASVISYTVCGMFFLLDYRHLVRNRKVNCVNQDE